MDTEYCPVNSVRWFNLRGSDNTGVPTVYSLACVIKRTASTAVIEIVSDAGAIYIASTNDGGQSWTDWQQLTKLKYADFQITKTLNAHELKGQNVTISSSYTVVSAKAISCSPTLGYVNNVIVIPGYHVGSNCWISLFNATTENVPEQTYTIRVFYY